ncbi:MAG: class I tRNA ligase family protein, partial [Phycisphaerales bacterium JB038]
CSSDLKVLFDLGHVSTPEPFHRLFNQGKIQAHAYTDERGMYVDAHDVVEKEGKFFVNDQEVRQEYGKMGKSLKNAVSPDEIFEEYGADTLRLYEMYMGPLEASKPWNTRDIVGVHRFLQRFWRALVDEETGESRVIDDAADDELRKALHKTIDGVTQDMEGLAFNTAIAKLIELNNKLTNLAGTPREVAEAMVQMVAPLTPHIAEELWHRLGKSESVAWESFPQADPDQLGVETVEITVLVKGKVRARINVAPGLSAEDLEKTALTDAKVQELIGEQKVRKVIAVPDRMVNIVL